MLEYLLTLCETQGSESWGMGVLEYPLTLCETLGSKSQGIGGVRIPTYPM